MKCNHSAHRRSNCTRRYDHNLQPMVQPINNNVKVSFDIPNNPENVDPDSNNIIAISSHDHEYQRYEGRDNSSEGSPDSNASSSRKSWCNGCLWDHSRLPRYSLEHSTGRRGDNRMQRYCPNRTSQYECDIIDNNLNSTQSPSIICALFFQCSWILPMPRYFGKDNVPVQIGMFSPRTATVGI